MKENNVIHLRGMEFYGYHGVMPEEKITGQRFIVDMDIYPDVPLISGSDNIEFTVDYAEVYGVIKRCVEEEKYNLLETLAEQIVKEVMKRFSCTKIRVEVHKPNAPIPGMIRDISVELKRERKQ
ncbi:dihydroneopterin aldolase [Syntrophobotulus glycolicus]|nr:dihydroneopterin aldolase [Syntrophobotulus glycolicus]